LSNLTERDSPSSSAYTRPRLAIETGIPSNHGTAQFPPSPPTPTLPLPAATAGIPLNHTLINTYSTSNSSINRNFFESRNCTVTTLNYTHSESTSSLASTGGNEENPFESRNRTVSTILYCSHDSLPSLVSTESWPAVTAVIPSDHRTAQLPPPSPTLTQPLPAVTAGFPLNHTLIDTYSILNSSDDRNLFESRNCTVTTLNYTHSSESTSSLASTGSNDKNLFESRNRTVSTLSATDTDIVPTGPGHTSTWSLNETNPA